MRFATANNISALLLKALGERKVMSADELTRMTGLLPDELEHGLRELQSGGLIEPLEKNYALTERGEKARYFVAS
jgi:predicted transcriptional regulator